MTRRGPRPANPTHTYGADGTFTVRLTVTDNRGGTDSVTKSVEARANVKPTAAFSSDCTNLACSFDASSRRPTADGTIASYSWNFGDQTSATGAPDHATTTPRPAPTRSTLTVTDNKGATDTVTKSVTVQPANQTPTAAFTSAVTDLRATFDGRGSSDPDGTHRLLRLGLR